MLSFYSAPEGLIPLNWVPTQEDIDYVTQGLHKIVILDLTGEAELAELEGLLETPLAALVPLGDGKLSLPSTAQVERSRQFILLGDLAAGPWRAVFADSLLDVFETALRESYARHDNLLIIRT